MNSILSETATKDEDRDVLALHGYRLASGLMWRDRHALFILPLILALPGFFRVLVANDNIFIHTLSSLVVEILRLSLLYFLTVGLLHPHQQRSNPATIRTLFIWGGTLWCISMLPSIALFPDGLTFLVSALLCFACTLMLYFFFTPIIAGTHQFSEIMGKTIKFTTFDTLMPMRALFAPFSLAVLLAAIGTTPMPSTSSLMYHEVCYGLATTLSTYCAVAFGVSYWARHLSLDFQNTLCLERIELIEAQAPAWLNESLNFRSGAVLALFALAFWTNSITSIYSLSENTKVEIEQTTIKDRSITLNLKVRDTPSSLRNFHPMLLSLASDNRSYLAQYPSHIILNNESYTPSQTVYSYDTRSIQDGILSIAIHFQVDKDQNGLAKLKDIYLWYSTTKISRVTTDQQNETTIIGVPPFLDNLNPNNSQRIGKTKVPYVDVKNSSSLRIPLGRSRRLRSSRA